MSEGTPLKLEVTSEQIKDFVAEAILQQLDDATKNEMIAGALKHLVTKGKSRGYPHTEYPSPLEEAYNRAVSETARGIVGELVKDEFKDRIESVCRDALEKIFAENREKLVDGIAQSMQRAMYDLQDKG
jgi:hypothetical protein